MKRRQSKIKKKINAFKSEQAAQRIRSIFHIAAVLQLSDQIWPKPPKLQNEAVYDYIIVGGGTAGCLIASRLLEIKNATVLLVEAGVLPPVEAAYPRYFPYLKHSVVDWNFTSTGRDPGVKYFKRRAAQIPQGKMLGGTSNLNYMVYGHSNDIDFNSWATVARDKTWLYNKVMPFYKKNENLIDEQLRKDINVGLQYGNEGKIQIKRFFNDGGSKYMNAFQQMGHKIFPNINSENPLGFAYALYNCGDKLRQDSADIFLKPVKEDPRLHILTSSLVTKIIFNSENDAVGVNIERNDTYITVMAKREIIISAGVFKSPQLLMLSGIGPKKHLTKKKIKMRVNLPVGQKLQVSPVVISVFKMGEPNKIPKDINPFVIEFPVIEGYVAEHSHDFPDYMVHNVIIDDPESFLELCVITFNFKHKVCDQIYKKVEGKQVYIVMNHLSYPKSRGHVLLGTTRMSDKPNIELGIYSEDEDRENHAKFLLDFYAITNTTFFKQVNSKLIIPGVPRCSNLKRNSIKFWKCYASALVTNSHNYASTCAMGRVVDSNFRVKGVNKLRVVDASAIPVPLSAPIAATVLMMAEKAVHFIKQDHYDKYSPIDKKIIHLKK